MTRGHQLAIGGRRRSITTLRQGRSDPPLSSSSKKTISSRSVGSSDASSNLTSLLRSPALVRRTTSCSFSYFHRISLFFFFFRALAAFF